MVSYLDNYRILSVLNLEILPRVAIIGISISELHHWHCIVYDVVTSNEK